MAVVIVRVDKKDLDHIKEMFEKMGEQAKETLHEAVNKGAEYLQPRIRNGIVLGNEDDDTLHLRNTVRLSKAKKGRWKKQTALVRIGGIKKIEYPMHLETGHMTEDGRHIPARPYIRSTADMHQEKVAEIVVDHILRSVGLD